MSESINYLPIDQLPTDEHGLFIIPAGYPPWGEALEINRERTGALLSNKVSRAQPEIYDLPLLDGISKHHQAFYYKTANDIVTVSFSIFIEEGEFEVYNEIAILPEGFRPAEAGRCD